MVDRRPGDVAVVYGDASRALNELGAPRCPHCNTVQRSAIRMLMAGWKAELGLDDMCSDAWRWSSNNPDGFK